MQRWGLHEANLPPGAIVLFKQPTLWDQYRAQVLGSLAIVLLQAALIAWLLIERERRRRATAQAGKATAESGQYRESLAHLVRVHTVGEMSTAIAHEVNQPLAAIKNYAFAARRRLAGRSADAAKVEELLDKIEEQASRAGDVLHSLRAMVKKHESERAKTEVGALVADAAEARRTREPRRRHPARILDRAGPAAGVRRQNPDPAGGVEPDAQRHRGDGGGRAHRQRSRSECKEMGTARSR